MLSLRKPTVHDVQGIYALMRPHILRESLLPRTERQIIERLRDYTVAERDGDLVGVVSIALVELHLAELGVLVCSEPAQAERLVAAALTEAESMGVNKVFVLAPETDRYQGLGFRESDLANYPEKRDRQCLRCPRLPRCRQVLLERTI